MKQKELSKWMKAIIFIACLMGLVFCVWVVPSIGHDAVTTDPELGFMYWPCLLFIWLTAIPFYASLYISFKICGRIAMDESFCAENALGLKHISILSLLECLLYFIAVMTLLMIHLLHPGVLIMIVFIQFVGLSIAIVSAMLSHLIKKASDIKIENDLTI